MTDQRCEEVRALAPEVTLGIASGEERAALLGHVSVCESCRNFMRDLSTLADELLIAAPVHEPPIGFETRVLESIGVDGPKRRLRARLGSLAVAAAIAALLAGGAVWFATASDRRIGELYQQTLATANGEYFSAAELHWEGIDEEAGVVFAYQGEPSWLFVVLREGSGTYSVTARTRSGRIVDLGEATFDDEKRGWGADVMVDVHDITTVHLLGEGDALVATVHEK